MAENCRISYLKLRVLRQLEMHLELIIYNFMEPLSDKGQCVNRAVRSFDQEHSLLTDISFWRSVAIEAL